MHLRLLNLVLQAGSLAIVLLIVGVGWQSSHGAGQSGQVIDNGPSSFYRTNSFSSTDTTAFGGVAQAGKDLWNENACGTCHIKNMKDDGTGPALGGVTERWAGHPRADLYDWIRESQALVEAKHPRALQLWKDWGPTVMQNYPGLSDEEIEDLLAYIEGM